MVAKSMARALVEPSIYYHHTRSFLFSYSAGCILDLSLWDSPFALVLCLLQQIGTERSWHAVWIQTLATLLKARGTYRKEMCHIRGGRNVCCFLSFLVRQKLSKLTISSVMHTGENPDFPIPPCNGVGGNRFLA